MKLQLLLKKHEKETRVIKGTNQGYSGNQKNAFQGQGPDMENRHTQQRP